MEKLRLTTNYNLTLEAVYYQAISDEYDRLCLLKRVSSYRGMHESVLLTWVQYLGDFKLVDITTEDVEGALYAMQHNPPANSRGQRKKQFVTELSPVTLRNYLGVFSAFLNRCQKARFIPKQGWTNPCLGVEKPKIENKRDRFLSSEEIVRLIRACGVSKWDKLSLLVMLGIYTGARRTSLTSLKWKHVDLDRKEIHLETTKNGSQMILTLRDEVMKEFAKHTIGDPETLIFASRLKPSVSFEFRDYWTEALKLAGLDDGKVVFHSLRHTFASHALKSGISTPILQQLGGWKTPAMVQRYAHLDVASKRDAVNAINF